MSFEEAIAKLKEHFFFVEAVSSNKRIASTLWRPSATRPRRSRLFTSMSKHIS